MSKKIVYVDLDGPMANYDEHIPITTEEQRHAKGFFEALRPVDGAVDAFKKLTEKYDCYFLSTAPWSNVHSWSEKRIWVEKHLGDYAFKRLILTHYKNLLRGDYLIDDRLVNGVDGFEGEHIHYGTERFPTWEEILDYLDTP